VAQEDNRWLRFDDSNVTTVPLSRVLDDKAYLLFYQLRG
jgi:ubiquitin C-terminal hydrolase